MPTIILKIGAYAEYVAVSRHMLISKPSNWSWELAAAIPEVSS
jgi:NADPH:quinone reductase-like Zn-dependent oxidoreductase